MSIAVPTTTHSLKSPYRVWGKTTDILSCLSEFGGLTPREISDKTLVTPHDVAQTCRRCFRRGFVEPVPMGGYQLSPTGLTILLYNNNNNREQIRNKQGTNKEQIGNTCFRQLPIKTRQINLSLFERNEDLDDDQRTVVVALAKHYEETGKKVKARPYLTVHDYSEFRDAVRLSSKLSEADVQDIVISLEVIGYLYIKPMGNRHLKIGLTKEVISNLKYQ